MPKYNYILSDESGLQTKGVISANNKEAALKKLRDKNKIIISVTEKTKGKSLFFSKPRMSFQDKMMFTKHLCTMIKVGITVTEALEIMISQTKSASIRGMYEDIMDMVKTGQTLANSLKKYNYIFTDLFINMIQTGEESGNMEGVLTNLDRQLEKEYQVRKRIVSAFIYPAVIVGFTILMAIGIVVFIMPKITKIFESFDIPLPLPTKILIGASSFLTEQTLLAIIIFVGGAVGIYILLTIKALKPFWHRVTLHLPFFGKILVSANIARFSRAINSLLQAGVPITQGLRITGQMLDNKLYQKAISEAGAKIEQGGKLGEAFDDYEKLFPPLVTKMFYIGEQAGSLETTTERLAQLYESDVDSRTKNISVILEPFLLVFMGLLVGGIALSIILPIYQLPNLLQK